MTPREFCQPRAAATSKAAVHAVLMVTAGACVAYNAAAWLYRGEKHLAVNVGLYGALVAWEAHHIRQHWRDRQ